MKKISNFAKSNEITAQTLAFNRAVMYSLIIDEHKTSQELAKLMFFSVATAFKYCKWLESYNHVTTIDVPGVKGIAKAYKARNPEKYPYPKGYLESKDPRRDYFDALYPHIHKELRDAIYEGRISSDVVQVHKEADTDHWEMKKHKHSSGAGKFQSSISSEYVI